MKPWFSHRRLQNKLRSAQWTMDPAHKAAEAQHFLKAAEKQFGREASVSSLAFNWNRMKRYSLAYFAFLLLIGFGIANTFPHSGTLSAQELVSQASVNYEVGSGTIYYEKRETTDYVLFPGEVTTEEVWSNDSGDVLWTLDRNNGEHLGSMIKINEAGVPIDYEWPAAEALTDDQKTMADSIKRGAVYCATIQVMGESRGEALLQVSKENPDYWFISAGHGDAKDQNGYGFVDTAGGSNVKQILSSILKELNNNNDVSETKDYELEERTEDGILKYILSESWEDSSGQTQEYLYTFDAQTFTLEKQEYLIDGLLYSETLYLEHANYPEGERDVIFNAEKQGLVESPHFTTVIPGYIKETGCYDKGVKLSEEEIKAFLNTLPETAVQGYEETVIGLDTGVFPDAENPLLIPDESLEPDVDIKPNEDLEPSFVFPSSAHHISQGYTSSHPGLDAVRENSEDPLPDILASAAGTVISIGDGWNGGYGNDIWIDHENGYKTHYAHLSSINVKVGDTVNQGQVIAQMGNTGRTYGTTGYHLHFELVYNGEKINPFDYLSL